MNGHICTPKSPKCLEAEVAGGEASRGGGTQKTGGGKTAARRRALGTRPKRSRTTRNGKETHFQVNFPSQEHVLRQ
jgi:hypothetical protein